jgi:nicotinic acid mononucleotide adenylyltransferase
MDYQQSKYDKFKEVYEQTNEHKTILDIKEENLSDTKKNIVLIYPGAFNPITPFHLRIAEKSVEYMKSQDYNVVNIILLPANANYVKKYMTYGYLRSTLIHQSINSLPLNEVKHMIDIYKVSNYELYQSEFADTSITLAYFSNLYQSKGIEIYYICGYDAYESILGGKYTFYPYFEGVNFLVHPRQDATDLKLDNKNLNITSINDSTTFTFSKDQFTLVQQSDDMYIDDNGIPINFSDGSSTKVREYCENNNKDALKKLYKNDKLCDDIIEYYTNQKYLSYPLIKSLIVNINTDNKIDISLFKFELSNLIKSYNIEINNLEDINEVNYRYYLNIILQNPKIVANILNGFKYESFFFLNSDLTKDFQLGPLIENNKKNINKLLKDDIINLLLTDNTKMGKCNEIREIIFKDTFEYLSIVLERCKKYIGDETNEISMTIDYVQQNIYQISQTIIINNNFDRDTIPLGYSNSIHPYGGNEEHKKYSYSYSLNIIIKALEILDIMHRKYSNKRYIFPKYNFYNRYIYYLDVLTNKYPNVIIIPCIYNMGSSKLMEFRFTPYQICGINIGDIFIDESLQTPLEFFVHDINHSRRIYQQNEYFMNNNNMNIIDFYKLLNKEKNIVMNLILPNNNSIKFEREIKKIIKMLIFEAIHEDALIPTMEMIVNDILFKSGQYAYPYETILNDDKENTLNRTVYKWYDYAATTLSTFRKKLEYEFFDEFYKQNDVIMNKSYRNELCILIASIVIIYNYYLYNNKHINNKIMLEIINQLIKNIKNTKYTAKPYGIKYTNYKKISCKLKKNEINNLIKAFNLRTYNIKWKDIRLIINKYISDQ